MKILSGQEIVDFIKERQAHQVRGLKQAHGTNPKLAIIKNGPNPVTDLHVKLKQNYGKDILIDVDVYDVEISELKSTIEKVNDDRSIHGMIIQLPLKDPSLTDELVNLINPDKDVDGLSRGSKFISATATAIDWLLNGYGINLEEAKISIIGNGRLVGAPLYKLWKDAKLNVEVYDENTENIKSKLLESDVIVSATGVARLITSDMIPKNAVVVDAGTSSEDGKVVGDLDPSVRERKDLTITPIKGGVGPLTIAALFDNVISASSRN